MLFVMSRFFAWLVELIARHVLRVDLSLGTFGPFSVHGIKVKLKGGKEIVSITLNEYTPGTAYLFITKQGCR